MVTKRRIIDREKKQSVVTPKALKIFRRMVEAKGDKAKYAIGSELADELKMKCWEFFSPNDFRGLKLAISDVGQTAQLEDLIDTAVHRHC